MSEGDLDRKTSRARPAEPAASGLVTSAPETRLDALAATRVFRRPLERVHDLARRLDANRESIGAFSIDFTGYVDGIDNGSDFDIGTETALPPATGYHANYYKIYDYFS